MITLDANVFVYAGDDRFPEKQAIAQAVIRGAATATVPLSMQVIGETQNTLVRKLKRPPALAAQAARDMLASFDLIALSAADVAYALDQMEMGRLSYWDALLLSTVARAGCTALMTEDLQNGATVLGVEIVNPFGPDGLSPRAAELLAA